MTLLLERENTNSFALDLAKSTKPVGFPGGACGDEPANVGDAGDGVQSLGHEDPLEEGMATQSSILAWRINLMDRGAWRAAVRRVAEELDVTEVTQHACKHKASDTYQTDFQ